jgi:hypothetical protein
MIGNKRGVLSFIDFADDTRRGGCFDFVQMLFNLDSLHDVLRMIDRDFGLGFSRETNTEQYNAWQTIQRSHAVANGVHVVSVNRVGHEQEGRMKFWGGSFVSNPFGTILYQGTHDQEEVHVETLDLNKTDQYRTHWPFLRDRRIDSYQPITKRYLDEG